MTKTSRYETKQSKALRMYEVEGKSYPQIAEVLGSNRNAVGVLIHAARQNRHLMASFRQDRADILSNIQGQSLDTIICCITAAKDMVLRHIDTVEKMKEPGKEPTQGKGNVLSAHGLSNLLTSVQKATESLFNMEKADEGQKGTRDSLQTVSVDIQKKINDLHDSVDVSALVIDADPKTGETQDSN
tara:strand:- start:679 stop:1236 length:558 start_codon:yes stop_codon:yes gene_type:complete